MPETNPHAGDHAAQTVIIRHLITGLVPSAPALRKHTQEEAQLSARRMLGTATGAAEIEGAMRRHGLIPVIHRAQGYSPFSRIKGTKSVVVVPCNSTDENANAVGGIGVSDGEPASGVIVHLDNMRVQRLQTLDFIGGRLVEREITAKELTEGGPRPLVESHFQRGQLEPHLTIDASASIAGDAFLSLLHDEYATAKYTEADLRKMTNDAPLVSAIAELQYMRLQGLTMSPDTSCCSCCSCCWGSCSSCSAAASHYLDSASRNRWTA